MFEIVWICLNGFEKHLFFEYKFDLNGFELQYLSIVWNVCVSASLSRTVAAAKSCAGPLFATWQLDAMCRLGDGWGMVNRIHCLVAWQWHGHIPLILFCEEDSLGGMGHTLSVTSCKLIMKQMYDGHSTSRWDRCYYVWIWAVLIKKRVPKALSKNIQVISGNSLFDFIAFSACSEFRRQWI